MVQLPPNFNPLVHKFISAKLEKAERTRKYEEENRIPIPEGQAGRNAGYNLFEKMEITKTTFCALRVGFFWTFHAFG